MERNSAQSDQRKLFHPSHVNVQRHLTVVGLRSCLSIRRHVQRGNNYRGSQAGVPTAFYLSMC
jgi:hypothetical protein